MIFLTLGSQKFQFNRLLMKIDELIEKGELKTKIFAQIGYSDYEPVNFEYKKFLSQVEFQNIMEQCDLVITHGGTGAIITALKNKKKVIGVPRLSMYHEHVDDHQVQIVEEFSKTNLIESCFDVENLTNVLLKVQKKNYNQFHSNTMEIIKFLYEYIEES